MLFPLLPLKLYRTGIDPLNVPLKEAYSVYEGPYVALISDALSDLLQLSGRECSHQLTSVFRGRVADEQDLQWVLLSEKVL